MWAVAVMRRPRPRCSPSSSCPTGPCGVAERGSSAPALGAFEQRLRTDLCAERAPLGLGHTLVLEGLQLLFERDVGHQRGELSVKQRFVAVLYEGRAQPLGAAKRRRPLL